MRRGGRFDMGGGRYSRQGAAAGSSGGVWPLVGVGVESDWTFAGDWSWDSGTSSILINGSAGAATLTGAAKTAMDAAISNSTFYADSSLTAAGFVAGGVIKAVLKGGLVSPGSWEFEDNGAGFGGVTSGVGSGLVFSVDSGTPNLRLTAVSFAV